MKYGTYGNELRQAVIEDYKNSALTIREIGKKHGIPHSTVSNIAKQEGMALRRPKDKKDQNKTCPRCHKAVDVKGARFCPYCGSDIRSENEILAEQLDNLKELYIYIPEAKRDNFIQTINKTIETLKEARK